MWQYRDQKDLSLSHDTSWKISVHYLLERSLQQRMSAFTGNVFFSWSNRQPRTGTRTTNCAKRMETCGNTATARHLRKGRVGFQLCSPRQIAEYYHELYTESLPAPLTRSMKDSKSLKKAYGSLLGHSRLHR